MKEPLRAHHAQGPSDATLMQAIAERQETHAFELLYQRYEHPAYCLALHLTGSPAAAEEAVQDAMLRVWQLAGHFRPDGSFKGWFMTIVADRGMDLNRKRFRDQGRIRRLAQQEAAQQSAMPSDHGLEQLELSDALWQQLERLDPLERRLLALCYGANLNQLEIGRILRLPQTTVSRKIRLALEKLRGQLATAGFAAAMPLLESGQLAQALLSGRTAPPALRQRTMEALSTSARQTARSSTAGASKLPALGRLGLASCILLVSAGIWWLAGMTPHPRQPLAPKAAARENSASPTQVPDPGLARTPLRWTFDTPGATEGLEVVHGAWKFVAGKGEDGSGCMEITQTPFAARLTFPAGKGPWIMQARFMLIHTNPLPPRGYLIAGWYDSFEMGAVFHNLFDTTLSRREEVKYLTARAYFGDRFIDGWVDDQRKNVFIVFPQKSASLGFSCRGSQLIDNLEFRPIEKGALPDVSIYLRAYDGVPMGQRHGKVPLPQFPPAQTKLGPVYLRFFNALGEEMGDGIVPSRSPSPTPVSPGTR